MSIIDSLKEKQANRTQFNCNWIPYMKSDILSYKNGEIVYGGSMHNLSDINAPVVFFKQGAISVFNSDYGFSFEFTGCLMAQFRVNERTSIESALTNDNQTISLNYTFEAGSYIAHISTDSSKCYDCKVLFMSILSKLQDKRAIKEDCKIFKPKSSMFFKSHEPDLEQWGLIDENGKCYTIVVNRSSDYKDVEILEVVEMEPLWTTVSGYINIVKSRLDKGINYIEIGKEIDGMVRYTPITTDPITDSNQTTPVSMANSPQEAEATEDCCYI